MFRSVHLTRSTMRRLSNVQLTRRPYSSVLDPPGMTPKEDLALDAAAWFCALALFYSPDFEDADELHDEAKSRPKKGKGDPKNEY